MYFDIKEIEMSGVKLPYRFDMYVLEAIQTDYDTNLRQFTFDLMGFTLAEDGKTVKAVKEPSQERINFIWPLMVQEGYACRDKECPYDEATLVRMIDKTHYILGNLIMNEINTFGTQKKTPIQRKPKRRKRETASST